MDRDWVEIYKLAKEERGQYPAILTEQSWSIKDLYGFRGNFSFGTWQIVLSGQDSSILPARLANHSAGFDWSFPLTELSMYNIEICGLLTKYEGNKGIVMKKEHYFSAGHHLAHSGTPSLGIVGSSCPLITKPVHFRDLVTCVFPCLQLEVRTWHW